MKAKYLVRNMHLFLFCCKGGAGWESRLQHTWGRCLDLEESAQSITFVLASSLGRPGCTRLCCVDSLLASSV